jgi:nitroreductase
MLKVIQKRRSHRQFLDKSVEDEKINEILKAAMASPTARHTRAWEFVVVRDKKLRDDLAGMKLHSSFANNAPVILILVSPDWQYWVEDMSIAGEAVYIESTNQGLGTCWIEVHDSLTYDQSDGEAYVKKVLDIPADKRVLCMMPIGYPALNLPEHSESEFEKSKIHYEKW